MSTRLKPPKHTTVTKITVDGEEWEVWEFSFSRAKKLPWDNQDLTELAGRVIGGAEKIILLNTDLPLRVRHFTLMHEIAHIIRWHEKSNLPEIIWDELEVELMAINKAESIRDFPPNTAEVYTALKAYLESGPNPRRRARSLVNWLRERTDDPTQEGRYRRIELPKSALHRGKWWDRVST